MRIVYSAGNRVGANYQLERFLQHTTDTVAVAAYSKSSITLKNVNWLLDSLFGDNNSAKNYKISELFGHPGVPKCNAANAEILLSEVDRFGPDLIISDDEIMLAHVAQSLDIPLWYCSPVNLFYGLKWDSPVRYYAYWKKIYKAFYDLPKAERFLIYSPFGDLKSAPSLKTGFEWITPYYELQNDPEVEVDTLFVLKNDERISFLNKVINCLDRKVAIASHYNGSLVNSLNCFISDINYSYLLGSANKVFTTGCTSDVADALYNKKSIVCSPAMNDSEALLNAIVAEMLGIGANIGQIEYLDRFALDYLEEALDKKFNTTKLLNNKNRRYLHDIIHKG